MESLEDLESLERLERTLKRLKPQDSWLEKAVYWVEVAVLAGLLLTAVVAVLAVPVMLLWNAVATEVFNLNRIGYFQSCGLFLLARLLFSTTGYKKK